VAALIKRHKVHIIHTHDAKSIVYGALLKIRFPGIKAVTTLHGWVMRRRRSRCYQWLAEFGLRAFDGVVAVSDDLERKARQKNIHRVIRIHNAIDLAEWPPACVPAYGRNGPFKVGFIGRISKEKGPEQFLRVARMLAAVDQEIRFYMAGDGPMTAWIRKELKRLALEDRFTLMGHVPPTQMPGVYRLLNVLLSSSHTEGMPNTILEALSCGVPVVATRVGGVEELITDGYNGLLARDGDAAALARSILILRHTPRLAERLAHNGVHTISERFTFPRRVSAMEHLYMTLARKGYM
jgi:glycosyltransferase involved in cell wall biosynthesis